jgi:hypothetical protein
MPQAHTGGWTDNKWQGCIGNLRVWPKGENRRDKNKPVRDKLLLGDYDGGNVYHVRLS